MHFSFGKGRGKNILVVDISLGATGAAIVNLRDNDVPRIVIKTRVPFSVNEANGLPLETSLLASLRESLAYIAKNGVTIDACLVSLSSPWVDSFIKTVLKEDPKGFMFDKNALMELIDNERKEFNQKLKESFSEESEIFEAAVMDLFLNGYASPKPMKEKVTEAEVSFVLSATTKEFLGKIEDELIRSVGIRGGVVFHSFMYILYKVLSHSFRNLHSALLINTNASLTEILFLKHGSPAISNTLTFGPETIAVALAREINVPKEVSYSMLSLFAEGALDQKSIEEIDRVLTNKEEEWKAIWSELSGEIAKSSDVPYSIFLLAPLGMGKLMKTLMESIFVDKNIILIGDTNTFTKELVRESAGVTSDEKIMILSSFSNLIS